MSFISSKQSSSEKVVETKEIVREEVVKDMSEILERISSLEKVEIPDFSGFHKEIEEMKI